MSSPRTGGRRLLALRFDVDSVTCLERGIPGLLKLGERHDARFTFFVNMGRSFSWRHTVARTAARMRGGLSESAANGSPSPHKLPATVKLGRAGLLKTLLLNPPLGQRYRATLDEVAAAGHELGLHGGSNHATWQYALDELGTDGLERLFRGAFENFRSRYGAPRGFASPGFRYNEAVLDLMDREGFVYASDIPGDLPFRPLRSGGKSHHAHYQVPVNVMGERQVPLIEQGLARDHSAQRIVGDAVEAIRARPFALMYGHPYVEGVHWKLLDAILDEVSADYDLVTVAEYLRRYRETMNSA